MKFMNKVLGRYEVFARSNLRPSDTGIDGVVIWISAGEFSGKDSQHAPRVKVIVGGGKVTAKDLRNAPSVTIQNPQVVRGSLPPGLLRCLSIGIKKLAQSKWRLK